MRIAFLVFIFTAGSVVIWPQLPSLTLLIAFVLLTFALCFYVYRQRLPKQIAMLAIAILAGCLWSSMRGFWLLNSLLPIECTHASYSFTGRVVDLPNYSMLRAEPIAQFSFELLSIDVDSVSTCVEIERLVGERIYLSWYEVPTEIETDQIWQITAKLERLRGQVNPSGVDYQLRMMQKGFVAKGSVQAGALVSKDNLTVDGIRFRWREALTQYPVDKDIVGLILALTVGDTRNLSPELRELLQRGGTSHLMAISGLHIGIMALFGFWLGRLFGAVLLLIGWRQLNSRVLASIASILIALTYAALSGFALPTQRAVIMLTLFHLSRLVVKHWSLLDVWLYALFFVIVLDPLQAADGGLYLSFGAVLVLIFTLSSRSKLAASGWLNAIFWLSPQVVIFIGLIPLSIYLFGGFSLIGIVTNSFAIPWVSFTTVPLSLMGLVVWCFSSEAATPVLNLAFWSADVLLEILTLVDTQTVGLSWIKVSSTASQLLLASVAVIIFCLPAPWRFKMVVGSLVMAIFATQLLAKSYVFSRERRVTVFDVGQGLAVLIEADGQTLLYDTGPPLGQFADMFQQAIGPYLRSRGIASLDYLVVSHNDADHAGGVQSVISQFEVKQIYAGDVDGLASTLPSSVVPTNSCHQIPNAISIGSDSRFFFDARGATSTGNDSSCVLTVEFPELSVFLPGDISRHRELQLIPLIEPAHPHLNLVLAPHHGSKSSSSLGLFQQFRPGRVIVSAGHRSRYGHPHPEVVNRFQALGVELVNTAHTGAVQFRWRPGGSVSSYYWRETEKHFWFDG